MYVASAEVLFHIPHATSLKVKRQASRSIIERIRSRFNASVSEVGTQDVIQSLTIGIAVVSESHTKAHTYLEQILRFAECHHAAEMIGAEIH